MPDNRFNTHQQARGLVHQLRVLDAALHELPVKQHRDFEFATFEYTTTPLRAREVKDLLYIVSSCSRPDLIPQVFLKAYKAALHGQPFINEWNVSDLRMGSDPTCSDVLALLGSLDALLDTSLRARFDAMNATVSPFPFLELPAELRLHVYSHLFPRDTPLTLSWQTCQGHRQFGRAPRGASKHLLHDPSRKGDVRLSILATNHQLHDEVTDYFYTNRSLCMGVPGFAHRGHALVLRHALLPKTPSWLYHNYKIVAMLPARTRLLFHTLDVSTTKIPVSDAGPTDTAHSVIQQRPHDPFYAFIALLPNLREINLIWEFGVRSSNSFNEDQTYNRFLSLLSSDPQTIAKGWHREEALKLSAHYFFTLKRKVEGE